MLVIVAHTGNRGERMFVPRVLVENVPICKFFLNVCLLMWESERPEPRLDRLPSLQIQKLFNECCRSRIS